MPETNWIKIVAPAIIGVLLGFTLNMVKDVWDSDPDFSISVKPIAIPISYGPKWGQITVQSFNNYDGQILLTAHDINNWENPKGINIDFDKQGWDTISGLKKVTTNFKITLNNASEGEHLIRIIGWGSDGKQRSCVFVLKIN